LSCDEQIIPAQAHIADISDKMELDEVRATERQLLHVAATRARDRLLISGVAPGSEFLGDMRVAGGDMIGYISSLLTTDGSEYAPTRTSLHPSVGRGRAR
jgi:superfamily I DNA/RNA helicase